MKWVTIQHAEAGTARVPASSVPHHVASGWTVVEDAPVKPAPAVKPKDDAPNTEPPKDRRASKKETN